MTKFNDLTGQTFERLTVLYRVESTKAGDARWQCHCQCGIENSGHARNLLEGQRHSGGGLQTEPLVQ